MANLSWISSNPDYINQMIRSTQVTLSNNYNDLDNIPIIKITSTTNNPQKIWELKEGLYIINGVAQVDNSTSYEVSNLLISMTARLENGKYILSAFIPYLRGLFEYILKTNSTEYEQHQKIVLMIKDDTLTLDNETIYTPIENYHPATKKYVDDKANEIVTELDRMGINKKNLESLNKENRIRDIKLQALLSETSDRNITIEEDVRYFDMPLSIDNGIVTINEIVGETLVNVCDQEESVAITKSYTVENENHIALQGEYDGSCRPVLHGNTLVNHNADWDGKVQTGVVTSASGIEDVQVEGIKGQEVSVVVEGNTVLNHALGKTSAVVSSIEDNLSLMNKCTFTLDNRIIRISPKLKIGIPYTLIFECTDYSLDGYTGICFGNWNLDNGDDVILIRTTGKVQYVFTIGQNSSYQYVELFIDAVHSSGAQATIQNILLLEGDHTTNPKYVNSNEGNYVDLTVANDMSSVVEIEGRTMYYNNDTGEYLYEFVENSNLSLKSSYECEVTEDGKYKVDVKVTGKNLVDKSWFKERLYYDETGSVVTSNDYVGTEEYIKVKPNTTYNMTNNLWANYPNMCFYDKNKNIIKVSKEFHNTPFITPSDCYYIRFSAWVGINPISNIILEEGIQFTSYEPYFESTKTFYLNSPLLEGDKIVTKNGKVYHYHKMGKVVLDGSEYWYEESNNPGRFRHDINNVIRKEFVGYLLNDRFFTTVILNSSNEYDSYIVMNYVHSNILVKDLTKFSTVNELKKWLQVNPTTVVYELASPYYELIDEYNNTILNIPNTVAHLTHTSAVPVNNTVFTNYKDELNVLEPNTQYRLMFDCDTANIPFTVTLGGTSQTVTSKKGTHSLLITTPSELVDKNLVIDGIGRCGIDNIRIFKGDVEYNYVKGLWSGYEERKLVNVISKIGGSYGASIGGSKYTTENNIDFVTTTDGSFFYMIHLKEDYSNRPITVIFDCNSSTDITLFKRYSYVRYYSVKNGHNVICMNTNNLHQGIGIGWVATKPAGQKISISNVLILEGDWTDNPPTYEEVMANEGKYAVKVKLDNPNATIFGKGGRL